MVYFDGRGCLGAYQSEERERLLALETVNGDIELVSCQKNTLACTRRV